MEDERLVQMALRCGYVTAEQVAKARQEQRLLADRGIDHGIYFLLQDLGFLSEEDAQSVRKSTSSSLIKALEVEGFVIRGRLGSGGMGDVFSAVHPDGRQAAVKLLSRRLSLDDECLRRFVREGRAMQRLDHAHIVKVYGAGEAMSTRYILMELVDGPSLKTLLAGRGALDQDSALVLLRQLASALGHAWSHGVLHRDVKPGNIMLAPPRPDCNEPFCAKLCDFGLARMVAEGGDPDVTPGGLTATGLALGTPHYMSPEQATGERNLDQRADIYGLGATIYHSLIGETMYRGRGSAIIMFKQVTEQADLGRLRTLGTDPRLVDLLAGMLCKQRSQRIATWEEVVQRVARIGRRQVVQPRPDPAPQPPVEPPPPVANPPPRPGPDGPSRGISALRLTFLALLVLCVLGALARLPGCSDAG